MRNANTTFVGMDTSKKSIQVAMLLPDREKPVEWEEPNDRRGIRRLVERLKRESVGELLTCYEAGPCGYALQRDLRAREIDCKVIAPSLIPVKPGERIKTNRRDAHKLARQLKAGALTEVDPPTVEEEAVRDLCRCREDVGRDLMRARHRLGKMLLRHAIIYRGKAWTKGHRVWLRGLTFELAAERIVFGDYLRAIELLEDRQKALDAELATIAATQPWAKPVGWLRCFRGIDTVTAISVVAEIHGFERFESARQFMSYLGLVPSENSTGDRHRRGGITRCGNGHVRRLLIEAAQHYRHPPRNGAALQKRREGQPGWVVAAADRAQARLHRRYKKLLLAGKPHNKVIVAVARELAGFLWGILGPQNVPGVSTAGGGVLAEGREVLAAARGERAAGKPTGATRAARPPARRPRASADRASATRGTKKARGNAKAS